MNINKNNYEEIFIDYYDGILTAEQLAELFLFLESNPDLKMEFENFSNTPLESSDLKFPFKNELKKGEINNSNYSQYMIAAMEGDLSVGESKLLEEYLLANPSREKDYKLFKSVKLIPTDEVFPGKKELKQPIPIIFNFINVAKYAVAAILLLSFIAGAYFLITKSNEKSAVEFAQVPFTSPDMESVLPKQNDSTLENSQNKTEKESIISPVERSVSANKSLLAQENKREKFNKHKSFSNNQTPVSDSNQPEPVPVASVEVIEFKELPIQTQDQQIQNASPVAQLSAPGQPVQEKYMTVLEALRHASDRKLQKMVSDDTDALALADENISPRSSVRNFLEKGIEKVSNDKVSINTQNDPSSDVSRFSFSLGNFKIEKDKIR